MKRRIFQLVLAFALALTFLCGCAATGDAAEQTRRVERFDRIELINAGRMVLNQGNRESLRIDADADTLKHVKTRVTRGVLELRYDPKALFGRFRKPSSLTYYVGFRDLAGLEISGSGSVKAIALNTDSLEISVSGSGSVSIGQLTTDIIDVVISGSGDFDLSGQANQQVVNVRGTGRYRALGLISETTQITISGSGEVQVNARESLEVSISGSGRVSYAGQPNTSLDISGAGAVERVNQPLTRTQ